VIGGNSWDGESCGVYIHEPAAVCLSDRHVVQPSSSAVRTTKGDVAGRLLQKSCGTRHQFLRVQQIFEVFAVRIPCLGRGVSDMWVSSLEGRIEVRGDTSEVSDWKASDGIGQLIVEQQLFVFVARRCRGIADEEVHLSIWPECERDLEESG